MEDEVEELSVALSEYCDVVEKGVDGDGKGYAGETGEGSWEYRGWKTCILV